MSTDRAYTIVGAGAIGGTLGHALARAGHRVTIIDADAGHAGAIARSGIVVQRPDGSRSSAPVFWSGTPRQYDGPPLRRVLLATKARATEAAAAWIAPRLHRDGFVVSLQNGLNEPTIAGHVGSDRTVGAFVNLFADVLEEGVIADGGKGALVVGEVDGGGSDRVAEAVADLSCWGPTQPTDNVHGYLWAKLGFGAMLTATALADAPMGELIDRHRQLMAALAGEVFEVASAEGIRLEPFDALTPAAYLRGAAPAVTAEATDALVAWLATQSKNRSGIWRDIAVRHRPTEVHHHYAPVLRAASRHDIEPTSVRRLLALLREVESGNRAMTEENLVELESGLVREGTP